MSFSVKQKQKAILRAYFRSGAGQWKVLVLDKRASEIVGELFRGEELRKEGITVSIPLDSKRVDKLESTTGLYLVASSAANAKLIAEDARNEILQKMHICFLSDPAPIEQLVDSVMNPTPPKSLRISEIVTASSDFLCQGDNLFSLASHAHALKPETIAHGLTSALGMLGVVPIIRAEKGGVAEQVGEVLADRLRAELYMGKIVQKSLISRPLLVLTDRKNNLSTALRHPWTYRAMLFDVLGLKASSVEVTVRDKGTDRCMKYNLDEDADDFWRKHATSSFPEVASAIEAELKLYLEEVAEVNKLGSDVSSEISSLPDLARRKEMIDMHMNIATALLDEIKSRGLDELYRIEEDAEAGVVDWNAVMSVIKSDRGTKEDKLRLFLVCFLSGPPIGQAQLDQYRQALEAAGCDPSPIEYALPLKGLVEAKSVPPPATSEKRRLGLMVSGLVQQGKANLKKGVVEVAQNFNKLMTLSRANAMPLTRIVDNFVELKGGFDSSFTFHDPKVKPDAIENGPRNLMPFQDAIAFVVGGGNYIEYENLIEHLHGRGIVYGASALLGGAQFLESFSLSDPQP
eukprot:CAMPEP_0113960494 /NCGR_PEP_ID=MMETSP0011_2-20120614/4744_1 /TAXON_ID=101924 /ORGANISM="Rhodosorus marinus" /LENGTH=572 /DNA_ID=CAMNT_0000971949 /DNA_START=605 /DNA_END=2323 /DNA_ORIENTATION=+ /assembly_acc=CAM_ASM_000156